MFTNRVLADMLIQVRLMWGYWRRMPERMTGRFWERVGKE